jgi:GNAT superfamily N-acetyltransferase
MHLKLGTWDHYGAILDMIYKFGKDAYPQFELEDHKIAELVRTFLEDSGTSHIIILACDDDNQPVGMVAGACHETMFNSERLAHEMMWWMEPEFRTSKIALELQSAFEFWAKKVGATWVQMSSVETEYADRLDKFYKRKGFVPLERGYLKKVNN